MKNRGFTLLELLVVISIIGILVAIATVSFTTAQRQGRDSRRRQDIKALQNAFEQYNAKNTGLYNVDCVAMTTDYLQGSNPTDPTSGDAYTTSATCTVDSYCICAELETENTGNADVNTDPQNVCEYDDSGDEGLWCASNLQ